MLVVGFEPLTTCSRQLRARLTIKLPAHEYLPEIVGQVPTGSSKGYTTCIYLVSFLTASIFPLATTTNILGDQTTTTIINSTTGNDSGNITKDESCGGARKITVPVSMSTTRSTCGGGGMTRRCQRDGVR